MPGRKSAGKRLSFRGMALLIGVVPYQTANERFRNGRSISEALLTPLRETKRTRGPTPKRPPRRNQPNHKRVSESTLTVERLRTVLHYDQDTGVFTALIARGKVKVGQQLGNPRPDGYLVIMVDRVQYRANRLAWFYMTGAWPEGVIDHEDTDLSNNRFRNLRDVTDVVNNHNRKGANSNSGSGIRGVRLRGNRWEAGVMIRGKAMRLGTFDTSEQAIQARDRALAQAGLLVDGCRK